MLVLIVLEETVHPHLRTSVLFFLEMGDVRYNSLQSFLGRIFAYLQSRGEEMAKQHKEESIKGIGMRGAAVLAGAALLTKLIGVLQKIPLQNLAGDRVFGIYNAVYPLYQLLTVLATAGLPAAISIVIAQQLRSGAPSSHIRGTLHTAFVTLGLLGVIAALFLWQLADPIAYWIGDRAAASALRSLSIALAVVPLVAALRGYAQGMERMTLSAASQVTEQLVRVTVMVAVLLFSLSSSWDPARLTAAVMNGSAAGAGAALLLLVMIIGSDRSLSADLGKFRLRDAAVTAKRLFAVALPAVLGAAVVPAMGVVDAFTIPRLLQDGGLNEEAAMAQFGIYSRAMPLVQLVVMISGAAAGALVPRLVLLSDKSMLRQSVHVIIRTATLLGAAAALGLLLLAEPFNIMLYANNSGTTVFAIIGCTALASCILAAVSPLLQVLGAVQAPALLLLIAAGIKGLFNIAFTEHYGIIGAAIAGLMALSIAAAIGLLLSSIQLRRAAADSHESSKVLFAQPKSAPVSSAVMGLVIMSIVVALIQWVLGAAINSFTSERVLAVIVSAIGAAVGGSVFILVMLKTSFIGHAEWKLLGLSDKWLNNIKRWQSKR